MDDVDIRELTTVSEFRDAYPVLSQLRDHLSVEGYLDRLETMREEGYRLFALYEDSQIVAVVGGTRNHNFYSGPHLFVYDLVTDENRRSEGFGGELLKFVDEWAREESCDHVALESGLWRDRAHEFYEDHGYEKFCYSFRKELD
ncbi:GNAT family N-acetyltransferase [Natronosalvus rutilus]|uniref:GNAT family N-acetyltransferase n=1 Tax=Natronosalvus rutilus TaxID=2953753 RepID=A0A9E7ND15_9EURY|nr:GNAT family N-acetyltransferase [Natronosalvus rutilus]UTF55665.1 GNAT family N-acetyltransferase [Natronosalvus rutilus]